jgi:alpha-L-fucosidase
VFFTNNSCTPAKSFFAVVGVIHQQLLHACEVEFLFACITPLWIESIIFIASPHTVIFNDIDPDIRWIGNEAGIAGITNWNTLDTAGFRRGEGGPPTDTLNTGNVHGKHWIPGEADVSIRPGWFFRASENDKVKSPEILFDLYLKSVGRGANLLLNVPPDNRGLIHENDSAAVMGFAALRKGFNQNLAPNAERAHVYFNEVFNDASAVVDGNRETFVEIPGPGAFVQITWTSPVAMNAITLMEDLKEGQACAAFNVALYDEKNSMIQFIEGTTIGRKRILSFPKTNVKSLRITIMQQLFNTRLAEVYVHSLN